MKWANYLIIVSLIGTMAYYSHSALVSGLPFTQSQFHSLLKSKTLELTVKYVFYLPVLLFLI